MTSELNIDVLKVASCSVDDWPLLEELSNINKKIIISTAGVELNTLRKVYRIFKQKEEILHLCIVLVNTQQLNEVANLNRIKELKNEFSRYRNRIFNT